MATDWFPNEGAHRRRGLGEKLYLSISRVDLAESVADPVQRPLPRKSNVATLGTRATSTEVNDALALVLPLAPVESTVHAPEIEKI